MKVGFVSLGCAKNLVDSEQIMGMLRSYNHTIVPKPEDADVIVVNTCGFIAPAKEESIDTIFEMAQYKEKNHGKLIVCGCLAQRYKKALEEEIPEIDAVIPIRDYGSFAKTFASVMGLPMEIEALKSERVLAGNPWQAYCKISDGCSNCCTFCAIPLIRGPQKSRTMEDILEEIRVLNSYGIKELTLIAQDTTKYGLDNYGKLMLPELIREIDQMEGIHWLRILYMYPDEITDEILDAMKASKKVVPYFDIPMQHASNRLLEKMNRRGRKEDVIRVVKKIREMFDHPILRTTAIVGFPSETEEEFEELVDFIKEIRWDRFGVFAYSREEGTPAYNMEDQIDETVANRRLARLMEVQEEISLEKNKENIGRTLEVLVEEKEAFNNRYRGRSYGDAPDEVDGQVIFTSEKDLVLGDFVQVEITDAKTYDLIGVWKES